MADKRVRWGLLSTARINERLIPPIRKSQRSELLAVASRSKEKAHRYAAEWDIPRAYATYEEMLADPDVDVVYIPLPNSLHAEWSIKTADTGKHILCEKPLALTPEEVDRMTDAARRNGVILQEAAMFRYHPHTHKLKELVGRGAIGDVRLIRGVFTFTLTNEKDIRLEPNLGGGCLWDLGTYPVRFIRTMLGANPIEVQGWQVASDSGVDLSFMGQMRFAAGTLTQFFCSFEAVPERRADLIGSNGIIHADHPWLNNSGEPANVHILRGGAADASVTFGDSLDHLIEETLTYEKINAYESEIDSMVASILDRADVTISLEDSRDNVATVVALYTSAREGRPVQL